MGRPTASSRRRPKRQRTPTTLYSDDNPSTFTRKGSRGESGEPMEKPPKPSFYFVEEDVIESPSKRPYRRRKPYHKDDILKQTAAELIGENGNSSNASQDKPAASAKSTTAVSPTTPNPPPVKRKRGRPPKNRNLQPPPPPPKPEPTPVVEEIPQVKKEPPTVTKDDRRAKGIPTSNGGLASSTPSTKKSRTPGTPSSRRRPSAPQDVEGTFLSHSARVAPILPPVVDSGLPSSSPQNHLVTKHDHAESLGNQWGRAGPLKSPTWTPLYNPNVYFDNDYDAETNQLPDDLTPVTRSITCVTTRKPDQAYMAVGDSMGFCIIYSLEAHIRPVARLETVACQQRAREEQERIREQKRKNRRSLVMDTSQTTIHALGMIANRVVLATACELECMDVPSQTSLWVCPLTSDRLVTSLDLHLTTFDVLVSCSLFEHAQSATPTSPLMLLQHSKNNVEVCDANAPILLRSPCCTAIWDNSKNVENRLLFVAAADEDLELVLVQGGSIDNWKVNCKTRIPVKQSNNFTRLTQSPDGTYTMVASSRGIRLYQTETLQLIHVYGDQLSLHGKSVVWRDCLLLGKQDKHLIKHFSALEGNQNLECADLVKTNMTQEDKEDTEVATSISDLGQYVVGVPHFKGPKELCETLHVWKVEQAGVVPALSVPLPPKTEGVQCLVTAPSMGIGGGNGDRLVLAGRDGQGHVMLPHMKSNFAGIMYPPGYRVITDNIEYLEDEGELDLVVDAPSPDNDASTEEEDVNVLDDDVDEELDADMKEAMRQSLLDQKVKEQPKEASEEDVDVLNPVVECPPLIPCRPEAYLRHAVNAHSDDEDDVFENSPSIPSKEDESNQQDAAQHNVQNAAGPEVFVSNILDCLGHDNPKIKEGGGDFSFCVTAKVVIASAPAAARHGKRSRASNLETMLKASIDPRLQRFMFSKQAVGVDGSGSRIKVSKSPSPTTPNQVTPSPNIAPRLESDVNGLDIGQGGLSQDCNGGLELAAKPAGENDTSEGKMRTPPGNTTPTPSSEGVVRKTRPDDAAVLGLLGLSPRPHTPDAFSFEGAKALGSDANPQLNLNAPQLSDVASDTASRASSQNFHPLNPAFAVGDASGFTSSDRGSAISESELGFEQTKPAHPIDPNCLACRGRLVIHSCGKRALPIDYDEMAKAERERKEKEEEEKKRIRTEKRRLADQRRREARKQKQRELEERRRLEEEEARLEQERVRRMEEAASFPSAVVSDDHDRQRREMIVASYANHNIASASQAEWPGAVPNQPASAAGSIVVNAVDYNAKALPAASTSVAGPANGTSAVQDNCATAPIGKPPTRKDSMGTLSSADALVALAGFAGGKKEQPEPTVANGVASQQAPPTVSAYETAPIAADNRYSAWTSAFNAGSGIAASEQRRAIPSFAALRGQVHAQEVAAASAAVASAFVGQTEAAKAAALGAAQPVTTTYVWPPRAEDGQNPFTKRTHSVSESYYSEEKRGINWPS